MTNQASVGVTNPLSVCLSHVVAEIDDRLHFIKFIYNLKGKFISHLSFEKGELASGCLSVCKKKKNHKFLSKCGPAEVSCEFKQDKKRNLKADNYRSLPCRILGKQCTLSPNGVWKEEAYIFLSLTSSLCDLFKSNYITLHWVDFQKTMKC